MLRVLTLSTLFPDASRPNFGVFVERQTLGLAWLNLTLGELQLAQCRSDELPTWAVRIGPSELLYSADLADSSTRELQELQRQWPALAGGTGAAGPARLSLAARPAWAFDSALGLRKLCAQLQAASLAGWGAQRLAEFPDVPTLVERGFPEAEYYIWAGVFAPAATPAPVREALRAAMAAAAADPELRRAVAASGNTLDHRDGEAFAAFFRDDSARLARAVRRIGKVE